MLEWLLSRTGRLWAAADADTDADGGDRSGDGATDSTDSDETEADGGGDDNDDGDENGDEEDEGLTRREFLEKLGLVSAVAAATPAHAAMGRPADQVFVDEAFRDETWTATCTTTGDVSNAAVTTTPATASGHALQVTIPAGAHRGLDATYDPQQAGAVATPPTALAASYRVKFGADFTAGPQVSVLPGPVAAGNTGDTADAEQWAARLAYRASGDGTGIKLGYQLRYIGADGITTAPIWATTIPTGQWLHLRQHVTLNTTADGQPQADGRARLWVDGTKHVDVQGIRFTATPGQGAAYRLGIHHRPEGKPASRDQTVALADWRVATTVAALQAAEPESGTTTDAASIADGYGGGGYGDGPYGDPTDTTTQTPTTTTTSTTAATPTTTETPAETTTTPETTETTPTPTTTAQPHNTGGNSGEGGNSGGRNRLVLEGDGSYDIWIVGRAWEGPEADENVINGDGIIEEMLYFSKEADLIEGQVEDGGVDSFTFRGDIAKMQVDDGVTVRVNGRVIEDAEEA